jgi:hypothetical protein
MHKSFKGGNLPHRKHWDSPCYTGAARTLLVSTTSHFICIITMLCNLRLAEHARVYARLFKRTSPLSRGLIRRNALCPPFIVLAPLVRPGPHCCNCVTRFPVKARVTFESSWTNLATTSLGATATS